MPTYEYVCKSCGHLFEIVQSMRDDPLTECPECGGELRRVFAPPAISFKGSGFYATDHGKKAKTGADKTDVKAGADASDAKPGEKKQPAGTSGAGPKKDTPTSTSGPPPKKEEGRR
jgi:putative FmdB family regulatory protein